MTVSFDSTKTLTAVSAGESVKVANIKSTRLARVQAFNRGSIIPAPARANSTAYAVNEVFTRANGTQFIVTSAGTTDVAEPAGLLAGRPLTDGTVVGYDAGFVKQTADARAPTISQVPAAGLAAVGLTALNFGVGTAPAAIVSSADGLLYSVANGAFVGITQGASGTLAAGVGNATVGSATALPVPIGGECLSSSMCSAEFIIEDSKFGLTCHNFGFSAIVHIDDRPLIGNGAVSVTAGSGNAIVFDFAGVSAPRKVTLYSNNQSFANLRGVALTAQGKVYAVPRNGDVMIVFGDSFNNTVLPNSTVNPNVSYWLKNYLGLDGLPVMAVGGSGYVQANANTYNLNAVLDSPSNRLLFDYYKPEHILVNTGGNDGSRPIAAVKTAAIAAWQKIRELFPQAKITVTDGNSGNGGPSAASLAISVALQQQFAIWADPNSRFIKIVSESAATAWITGTSHVGLALAAGNCSFWISTDGTHPSPGGAQFLGKRLAKAISLAWNGDF